MEEWIKMRRAHLIETITLLQRNVTEHEKIDVSGWDNLNKDNVIRVIEDSQKLIDVYTEEIKLIDRS